MNLNVVKSLTSINFLNTAFYTWFAPPTSLKGLTQARKGRLQFSKAILCAFYSLSSSWSLCSYFTFTCMQTRIACIHKLHIFMHAYYCIGYVHEWVQCKSMWLSIRVPIFIWLLIYCRKYICHNILRLATPYYILPGTLASLAVKRISRI